ncbi:MAG: signal peptidase II [Planctomycetaceae bacterium]
MSDALLSVGRSAIRSWIAFLALAAVAAGVDLATKSIAFARLGMPGVGPRHDLIPGVLMLETNLNEGALFGMGQGLGLAFAGVSVLAIAGILAMMARQTTRDDAILVTALGLIVGGIVGNLYDRLGLPGLTWHAPAERIGEPVRAVRDWIHCVLPGVIDWPIFNLADTWLVIGAGLILLASLRPTPAAPEGPSA